MHRTESRDGVPAGEPAASPDPLSSLKEHFGHPAFREGQEAVVRTLLAGRSALAIFPTGAGKSLCYQLPALLLPGLTVVISPLIALMKDQVDALRARGIAAARIDSSLDLEQTLEVYDSLRRHELRLLYLAPERLLSAKFLERLESVPLAMLAVDEAHCISEWGHNFRPEYLRIARVAERLRVPRVLALTATATPEVAEEIARQFHIGAEDIHRTGFHRPNLFLRITPAPADKKLLLLVAALRAPGRLPAVVYATRQETTEHVAGRLAREGFRARAYHAGLADDVRTEIQEAFMAGKTDVIVATIAFGMGIDKANLRAVIHYNLPKTLENYQQEIGRAGRDGLPAHCELLACADDAIVLENFTLGDTPEELALRALVDHLLRQGNEFAISRYDLSRTTDIRPLVLDTVLTYLEQDGILEPVGSFYSSYRWRFLLDEARVLAGHTPARQDFLRRLFASAKRGPRWLSMDVDAAAGRIGEPRERILKALQYLEEAHDIELQPSGVRHQYRLLEQAGRESPHAVATRLLEVFRRREENDLKRLERVMEMAADPGCTTNHLLRYFGESPAAPCGHCANCLHSRSTPVAIPRSRIPEITIDHLRAIRALRGEKLPALRSARQLARFLCGLSSPATTRDRLQRHDAFGLLAEVPFALVLEQVSSDHVY